VRQLPQSATSKSGSLKVEMQHLRAAKGVCEKFVQNFTYVLLAMGQFALDHIQRQHRRCKRIRQYLPFVVKLTIGGNIVRLSCHEMVMIIYSTGDDDSMICQWVTFQGCFEHQVLRLGKSQTTLDNILS